MLKKVFFLVILILLMPIFCFSNDSKLVLESIGSASSLWKGTIDKVIIDPLWNNRDAYDSGHVLMVPLHFSFVAKDKDAIYEFEQLFARFSRQELPDEQLKQVHWMYLVSRYLSLKKQFNVKYNSADRYLIKRLLSYVHARWLYLPSFQWGKYPFVGIKSRLDYVMSSSVPLSPSYYRAVTDNELFIFAISSDLLFVIADTKSQYDKACINTLFQVRDYLVKIIESRGFFTCDGGWLFQKGVWSDHRDFLYSGHSHLDMNLQIKKVKAIAEDSSHSHRWPLWLRSFYSASENFEEQVLFKKISIAFSKQFFSKVTVIDSNGSCMKLNNYMDGSNGIYRYKYQTVGSNNFVGYGPFSLSGILGEGWYSFLPNSNNFYEKYSKTYPLSEDAIKLYVGPNTTRSRNKYYKWPDFFTNGFAELIAKESYYLAKNYKLDFLYKKEY